jgi:hypothetical protein
MSETLSLVARARTAGDVALRVRKAGKIGRIKFNFNDFFCRSQNNHVILDWYWTADGTDDCKNGMRSQKGEWHP